MDDVIEKIDHYIKTYSKVRESHYAASKKFTAYHKRLGIWTAILTAIVGTSVFASISEYSVTGKSIIPGIGIFLTGLLSILATILSALQTFLQFAELSDKHKKAGESYSDLKQKFVILNLRYKGASTTQRDQAISDLEKILAERKKIAEKYPAIPDGIFERISARALE